MRSADSSGSLVGATSSAISRASLVQTGQAAMSHHSSERTSAIAFTGGSAQALMGLKVNDRDEPEPEQPSMVQPLSRATLAMILMVYMYMDSSVSLWNQLYKESQLGREDSGCEPLRRIFCEDHLNRTVASPVEEVSETWLNENSQCRAYVPSAPTPATAAPTVELLAARRLEDVQLLGQSPVDDAGNSSPATVRSEPATPAEPGTPTAAPVLVPTETDPPHEDSTVAPEGFDGDDETLQERGCTWKITRGFDCNSDDPPVCVPQPYRRRPQTYTKGAALGIQATCGLMVFYAFNYWAGGMEQLKMCFDVPRLLRFGLVGCAFGLSAVFSFFAQDALPPGSYALYAQSGIIVVPILWRVVFNTPLPYLTWVHVVLIGIGIVMYRVSEMGGGENSTDGVGLFWVGMKVGTTSLATVFAELFLKGDPDVPFSVQCAYILPWKILTTFSTIFVLPPHHLPDRPGGILHDWNFLTVLIIAHNLGDTIGSAIVAKLFDSVVKAVCGVLSIIMPTWVVSFAMGWETIAWATAEGQLKVSGATIVVLASLAYTLGRNMTGQMDATQQQLTKLEEEQAASSYRSPVSSKGRLSPGIEMPSRDFSRTDSTKVSTVYEDDPKSV